MAENSPTYGSLPTGVLLGMAQNTYRSAIRVALVEAGTTICPGMVLMSSAEFPDRKSPW